MSLCNPPPPFPPPAAPPVILRPKPRRSLSSLPFLSLTSSTPFVLEPLPLPHSLPVPVSLYSTLSRIPPAAPATILLAISFDSDGRLLGRFATSSSESHPNRAGTHGAAPTLSEKGVTLRTSNQSTSNLHPHPASVLAPHTVPSISARVIKHNRSTFQHILRGQT